MNSFIETLNQWGGNFLSFAWPMLWQSSLLITALFAFDLLFRRRLRASIRYALWLVVLIKLCVPPTLALPTSPAWWLHKTPPPIVTKPAPHYTITYDDTSLSEMLPAPLPAFVPPRPVMNFTAWLLMLSAVASSTLLGWLLVRWWQITRQVRRAATSERLTALADEAQQSLGMKSNVRVKLTTNSMSPAVCGLFRPAILIPQSLAENFSDEQLRAVLLHELIHLRRRDVWVNFVQALLQIFYWWHPLVWLTNARIRRVREEAVDDAVMLALHDDAEAYAPTLLEVAKLALNRPLVSLGLVGIMESRNALRQRIERLLNFRAPKKTGLTFLSCCGIFIFSAVALPMGEGPAAAEKKSLPDVVAARPSAVDKTNSASILITAHFFRMSQVDFQNTFSDWKFKHDPANNGSWIAAWPQPFSRLLSQLKSSGSEQISAPRAVTFSGSAVTMSIGNSTNEIRFDCTPVATNGRVNLTLFYRVVKTQAGNLVTNQFHTVALLQNQGGIVVSSAYENGKVATNLVAMVSVEILTNTARFQQRLQSVIKGADDVQTKKIPTSEGRQTIASQLGKIRLDNFSSDGLPLGEVLQQLAKQSGINFLINDNADYSGTQGAVADLKTGLVANNPAPSAGFGSGEIPVTVAAMQDTTLTDALDAMVKGAAKPVHYVIHDYGVEFKGGTNPPAPAFFMRAFTVNTNTFPTHLFQQAAASKFQSSSNLATSVALALRNVFTNAGVNLESPSGKAVFYNDKAGKVFVRATEADLDAIERILFALIQVPTQIHIKARFLEMPKGTLDAYGKIPGMTNQAGGNAMTGILTDKNFRTIWNALQSKKDVEILAEPEATTVSGQQSRMMTGTEIPIIGSVTAEMNAELPAGLPIRPLNTVSATNNNVTFHTTPLDTGAILDSTASVLADGYTIQLRAQPSFTEFFGYAAARKSSSLPEPRPSIRFRKTEAVAQLYDGQTLLLTGFKTLSSAEEHFPKRPNKDLLVFITATIVDPAGNRVHSEEDLRVAQKGVPPQPPLK